MVLRMSATTLSPSWLIPTTQNVTLDNLDLDFIASLAILPSSFAAIALLVWAINVIVVKFCQRLDPAVAILRFTPGKADKIRSTTKRKRKKVGPHQVLPLVEEEGNTDNNANPKQSTSQSSPSSSDLDPEGDDDTTDARASPETVTHSSAHAQLKRTNTLRAGKGESRALLANLENFAKVAEQRIAAQNPQKFRNANGKLKNTQKLQRLVLEELTKRGTAFQFLNAMRHRSDFFEFHQQEVVHATTLTRQSFPAGRRILYLTFSGTSFSRCLVGAIIFLCYSGVFCSGAYICDQWDQAYGTSALDQYMEHCKALGTITDAITEYVTFMTVTYAVQSLTQWINVMTNMYKIHSAITSLGLLWTRLLPFNDNIAMETKYKVYRWLNVLHVYIYRRIAGGGRDITHTAETDIAFAEHLVIVGLLTEDELERIRQANSSNGGQLMVLKWLSDLGASPNLTGIGAPGTIALFEILAEIRLHSDALHMELQKPPISWAQLMQLLIDVYLLFSPLGFLSDMFISELEVQVFPMLSTFLLSMFFLGMLGLVDIVNDPFGDDVDDFSPDSLLFSAERHLFAFLANPGLDYLNVLQNEQKEFSRSVSPANEGNFTPTGFESSTFNAYSRKLTEEERAFLNHRKQVAGDKFGYETNPDAPELENIITTEEKRKQEEEEIRAMEELHRKNVAAMRAQQAAESAAEAALRNNGGLFSGMRPDSAGRSSPRPSSAGSHSPRPLQKSSSSRSQRSSSVRSLSRADSGNALADVDPSKGTAVLDDDAFLEKIGAEKSAKEKFANGDFHFHH